MTVRAAWKIASAPLVCGVVALAGLPGCLSSPHMLAGDAAIASGQPELALAHFERGLAIDVPAGLGDAAALQARRRQVLDRLGAERFAAAEAAEGRQAWDQAWAIYDGIAAAEGWGVPGLAARAAERRDALAPGLIDDRCAQAARVDAERNPETALRAADALRSFCPAGRCAPPTCYEAMAAAAHRAVVERWIAQTREALATDEQSAALALGRLTHEQAVARPVPPEVRAEALELWRAVGRQVLARAQAEFQARRHARALILAREAETGPEPQIAAAARAQMQAILVSQHVAAAQAAAGWPGAQAYHLRLARELGADVQPAVTLAFAALRPLQDLHYVVVGPSACGWLADAIRRMLPQGGRGEVVTVDLAGTRCAETSQQRRETTTRKVQGEETYTEYEKVVRRETVTVPSGGFCGQQDVCIGGGTGRCVGGLSRVPVPCPPTKKVVEYEEWVPVRKSRPVTREVVDAEDVYTVHVEVVGQVQVRLGQTVRSMAIARQDGHELRVSAGRAVNLPSAADYHSRMVAPLVSPLLALQEQVRAGHTEHLVAQAEAAHAAGEHHKGAHSSAMAWALGGRVARQTVVWVDGFTQTGFYFDDVLAGRFRGLTEPQVALSVQPSAIVVHPLPEPTRWPAHQVPNLVPRELLAIPPKPPLPPVLGPDPRRGVGIDLSVGIGGTGVEADTLTRRVRVEARPGLDWAFGGEVHQHGFVADIVRRQAGEAQGVDPRWRLGVRTAGQFRVDGERFVAVAVLLQGSWLLGREALDAEIAPNLLYPLGLLGIWRGPTFAHTATVALTTHRWGPWFARAGASLMYPYVDDPARLLLEVGVRL